MDTLETYGLSEVDFRCAVEYYKNHRRYIERILKKARGKYPPSESDAFHPDRWKAETWSWFLTK